MCAHVYIHTLINHYGWFNCIVKQSKGLVWLSCIFKALGSH